MRLGLWIKEIEFADGTQISLTRNDIVVLVGPNNSGKSTALREIANFIETGGGHGQVIKKIVLEKKGTINDIIKYIDEISSHSDVTPNLTNYRGLGWSINTNQINHIWNQGTTALNNFAKIFVKSLNTVERLQMANTPSSIDFINGVPNHPIHFLFQDEKLELKFSKYFKEAFGTDLLVDRYAGSIIPLFFGDKPLPYGNENEYAPSFSKKIKSLDRLDGQGDGMKSFVGILLFALLSKYFIFLIDEPEAFLHPPQAKLLAKFLVKESPIERQLFIATHSEDFLKGLIDTDSKNLNIIRIERDKKNIRTSLLLKNELHNVWKDPILRYSNVLSGLFHSMVIICESDSDCRFYSAILAAIYEGSEKGVPDILFIHCGGKDRIPVVIKALTDLKVPIKVVTDFDVLNDLNPLKKIFENLGGQWREVEKDWKLVKESIDKKKPPLEVRKLKDKIEEIFKPIDVTIMPEDAIKEISKTLKQASAWTQAKAIGKQFIPNGDETKAFNRIQKKFQDKGLNILEVGEIENFSKSTGNHGPTWVNEVLKKKLKTDSELELARKFILQLLS